MKFQFSNIKKSHLIAGVGVAGLVIVAAIVYVLSKDRDSGKSQDLEVRLREETMKEMADMGIPGKPTIAGMERALQAEANPSPEKRREIVELFYRYPPNSRPLDNRMMDLMQPLNFQSALMPAFRSDKPATPDKPDYVFLFKGGPTVVTLAGPPFTATLEVYDAKTRERIRPVIVSAKVRSDALTGSVEVGDAKYGDNGKDGDKTADDGITTFSWQPAHAGRLYWGGMEIIVKFKVAEGAPELTYKLGFESIPSPPAIFTGQFKETVKSGSLIISAEIDVKKAGHYVIEANLFHKSSGGPVAYVIFNDEIESPGKQWIDLLFFGKIFKDKDLDGKFVMRNLRGFRDNIDYSTKKEYSQPELDRINAATEARNEPVQWQIPPFFGEYVTQSYNGDEFSDMVYDGPEKKQKLQMIEKAQ